MIKKVLLCLLVFFSIVLASVCSFADDKEKLGFYVPKGNEEIYGTWVNEDYDWPKRQKVIYFYWGYGKFYRTAKGEEPSYRFGFTIVDKWSDSAGNIWYKSYEISNNDFNVFFTLKKISKNATVLESVDKLGEYPTTADLNAGNPLYRIRYRQ